MSKKFGQATEHYDADGNLTGTSRGPLGCGGCLGLALAGFLLLGVLGLCIAHPIALAGVLPLLALAAWGGWEQLKRKASEGRETGDR